MRIVVVWILATLFAMQVSAQDAIFSDEDIKKVCISKKEWELHQALNKYRKDKGLPPIRLSKSLTLVAQQHVQNLLANPPKEPCNNHSWHSGMGWSPCCYTADHAQAGCMWKKPLEIAGYPGDGFEIVATRMSKSRASDPMMPAEIDVDKAMEGWKKSPGHNRVMINLDDFRQVQWAACGVGITTGYAVIWFGEVHDRIESEPVVCQ